MRNISERIDSFFLKLSGFLASAISGSNAKITKIYFRNFEEGGGKENF